VSVFIIITRQIKYLKMRSAEEIRAILESAKLDRKDLMPLCQEIVFDENFSGTELKLIELEDEISECIKAGDRLVIRGDGNDFSVLCTNSSTFEVKEAETSNSLLILGKVLYPEDLETANKKFSKLPSLESHIRLSEEGSTSIEEVTLDEDDGEECETEKILNVVHSYLELRRVKPNLGRILSILEPFAYRGPYYEKEILLDLNTAQCTLGELLEKVPGSQREIEAHIEEKLKTFNLKGKIRLVQSEYLFQVLSHVLDCVESNSWDMTRVCRDDVIDAMGLLHPDFVVKKVFDWFFVPAIGEGSSEASGTIFAMDEYKLCRFLGEVILKSSSKFNLTHFMKAWQQSVPTGLVVQLKQLEGLAVCDTESEPAVIWSLPEESLPDTIQDRFAVLFEAKPKWTHDEIVPFIKSLAFSAQSVGVLLTKHARVHTANNRKYYCAKHSK